MSLDTKYRPLNYDDVLGQESTKKILKQFVIEGRGFQQSYLFAGAYGTGKTTLGRIFTRALLCDAPIEGEPCNRCSTCLDLLQGNSTTTFTEIDAATNSGKDEIKHIIEQLKYDTFSGKRRLYLFDESHRLTKNALDALLKHLEETIKNTEDKQLVCIFCTTEPEGMRNTILSRCAPAFVIQPLEPSIIAQRLSFVCDQEGIDYDLEALQLISEITESHIRDALKAVEGVRMLGRINLSSVTEYLHLDLNGLYFDILENIGFNQANALNAITLLLKRMTVASCYKKLANLSMVAYNIYVGIKGIPVYWDKERLIRLSQKGDLLLNYALKFSSSPGQPSAAMLTCDISILHLERGVKRTPEPLFTPQAIQPEAIKVKEESTPLPSLGLKGGLPELRGGNTYVDPRGINKKGENDIQKKEQVQPPSSSGYDTPFFCGLLGRELRKREQSLNGSKR